MKPDPRELTGIVIGRDGEYLVGAVLGTAVLRWSTSPWDAWKTRQKDKAFIVARKVGGKRYLFNPLVGTLRLMEVERDGNRCQDGFSQASRGRAVE